MARRVLKALLVLTVSAIATAGLAAEDGFLLPQDDLPGATVAGHRVVFTRSGAFAVAKDGRWLLDGGLSYAMPGWNEWGTQVRRSGADDSWSVEEAGGKQLVFQGTLFDTGLTARFKFVERVSIIPGGLLFAYEVTPLEKGRRPQELALTMHFPIAETGGGYATLWPGFQKTDLPQQPKGGMLSDAPARGCVLYAPGQPRLAVVGKGPLGWRWLDDRAWQLNTFRLVGRDDGLLARLSSGETAAFSFAVLLGAPALQSFAIGPGLGEIDCYGRTGVSVSAGKILEGGLAGSTEKPSWLFESAEPFSGAAMTGNHKGRIWGASKLGNRQVTYEMRVEERKDCRAVLFSLRSPDGPVSPEEAQVAFAVPEAAVRSVAAEEPPDAAAEEPDPGGKTEKPKHVVRIECKEQASIQLRAEAAWTVSKQKIRDVPCYLLTMPVEKAEDGSVQACVEIQAGADPIAQEGKPQ